MKFTPSSSVSSSSTTTTTTTNSFRENICTSKVNNFGCLFGFLSRILCPKNLPAHPSAPIKVNKQQGFLKIVDDVSTTPNVVARLMGLDSIPDFNSRIPQEVSDSIKPVKSVKLNDLREETGEIQGQHRRAKTSFSFKETPDFFELEDDDFFVPSEVEKKKKKKKGVQFGKSEVGVKGHKQRGRRDKCGRKQTKNRDEQSKVKVFTIEDRLSLKISAQSSQKFDNNIGVRNQSYHLSPLKEIPSSKKEDSDGIKARKKKKKEVCLVDSKEDATECDSENLSPVSVLDHSEFISDPDAATSEEDAKQGERCHPRRDLDLELDLVEGRDFACDENIESSMLEERERGGNGERKGRGGGVGLLRKTECRKLEMLSKVNRLAEAEITNNSNWKYRGMLTTPEELEDAASQFGQLIFDHLLTEFVHQLVQLQSQNC